MNLKDKTPIEICLALLSRSRCAVQVSAVISDNHGIFAWGWNNSGSSGYGIHAEIHAVTRANRSRIPNAILWVSARRKKNGRTVTARPCSECQPHLQGSKGFKHIMYRDGNGVWVKL